MLLNQPKTIKVIGLDPSLRNWGIAIGEMVPGVVESLKIYDLRVINPAIAKTKQVRQNSLDLESAKQLCEGVLSVVKSAQLIFVEVPVGSQSARAMASYGICVGVLGALRGIGIPLHEVSPLEVKRASAGKVTATKQEMIQWAMGKHPEADWPTYKQKEKLLVNNNKAEHQADAIAAIYAGFASNTYKQMLPFLKQQT